MASALSLFIALSLRSRNIEEMRSASHRNNGFLGRGPLLMFAFAAVCVLVPGMFWWGTTFTRRLNDASLAEQLGSEARPRDLQHAIEEISRRLEEGRPGMDRWAAELVRISEHSEVAVRVSAAWCMQFDAHRDAFGERLREMLTNDPSPMVRRNAATSLAKSGDAAARPVLRAMLAPLTVTAGAGGRVGSVLDVGQIVREGDLVARLQRQPSDHDSDESEAEDDADWIDVRAPVPGTVSDVLVSEDDEIEPAAAVVRLDPSLEHIRNAIVGLALVGTAEDAELLHQIGDPRSAYPEEIRKSARWAAEEVSKR